MTRETEERARILCKKVFSHEPYENDEEAIIREVARQIHDELYHPECTYDNGWMDAARKNEREGWTIETQLPSRIEEYLQPWESTKIENIRLTHEQFEVAWDLARWIRVGTTTIDHLPREGWDEIEIPKRTCKRCGHSWVLRRAQEPMVCPKCKSPYWNKPKRATTELLHDR